MRYNWRISMRATVGERHSPSVWDALAKGVFANYASHFIGIVCSVIMAPMLISHLGGEGFGAFVAVGSILPYLFVLNLGTESAVPKYVAELWARKNLDGLHKLISSFFLVYVSVGLLLVLLAGICFPYIHHVVKTSPQLVFPTKIFFLLTVVNFALYLSFGVFSGLLFGLQKLHIPYWIDALWYVLNTMAAFTALHLGYGLIGVGVGSLLVRVLICIISAVMARTRCSQVRVSLGAFDRQLSRRLASPSLYFFLINVANLWIFHTDNIIISTLLGAGYVGAYSLAFRLCKVPAGLIVQVAKILLPHVSELDARGDFGRLRWLHVQTTKYSLVLSLMTFTCVATFGERLIGLWVGPENFVGMPVLLCFCVMWPLSAAMESSSVILQGTAHHKKLAWALILEGALNIGLSILLARRAGVLGVAVGTLIARLAITTWFVPWYTCRVLEEDRWEYVKSVAPAFLPVLPSAGLALLLAGLRTSPVLLVLGGSAAIGAMYIAVFYKLSLGRGEQTALWGRISILLGRSTLAAGS